MADIKNGEKRPIILALTTRKDLCEVRIRTGQTEVAVFTVYEPEE
ncbi:TPA: type I toxin-antitoxin system Hok family toxin [Escherichia coli]|nr:type I toxin-antitoxin system Hok family toxin [Escherichia coli]HCN3511677.1 type I toxin-antitoxin system Hok family toxin [Escherichia coli]